MTVHKDITDKITDPNAKAAFAYIVEAGTADYWLKRVKRLGNGKVPQGGFRDYPDLVTLIIKYKGKVPPQATITLPGTPFKVMS